MNELLLKLFQELWERKISKEELLKKASDQTGLHFDENSCLKLLNNDLNDGNGDTIDILISLGFMIGFSEESSPTMCRLLQSHHHHKHEDIAMLLSQMKDPLTTDCIYAATELQFEYLDYDDTYQFARKCIKALSAIGNDDAIDKIRLLSNSKIQEIAEYAKKELRYKELL